MTTLDRQERTARLMAQVTAPRPRLSRRNGGPDLGDGPVCLADSKHGRTYLTKDGRRCFCVHQSHDVTGLPKSWSNEPEPIRRLP